MLVLGIFGALIGVSLVFGLVVNRIMKPVRNELLALNSMLEDDNIEFTVVSEDEEA